MQLLLQLILHMQLLKGNKTGGHGVDIGTFVMTVNKPGLVDLGFRSFQNARLELKHKNMLIKL